jgi:hypothetical protein
VSKTPRYDALRAMREARFAEDEKKARAQKPPARRPVAQRTRKPKR